jgi:transcriptional regulator with XRE-family HTH domain
MSRKATKREVSQEALRSLGARLRELRLSSAKGRMTLKDVARALGVSAAYASQVELGRTRISLRNLRLLAGFYEVPPASLLIHLNLKEFDWLESLARPADSSILDTATPAERQELSRYLQYIRYTRALGPLGQANA